MFRLIILLLLPIGCVQINSKQLSTKVIIEDVQLIPFETAVKFIKSNPGNPVHKFYSAEWYRDYGIFNRVQDKHGISSGFKNRKLFYSDLALIAEKVELDHTISASKHYTITVFNISDTASPNLYKDGALNYGNSVYHWSAKQERITEAEFIKLISAYVSLGIEQVYNQ